MTHKQTDRIWYTTFFLSVQYLRYLGDIIEKKNQKVICQNLSLWQFLPIPCTIVNFSRMSPKLVRTYPLIVENQGITMAPVILRLISWKSHPQSIKIFIKLDFSLMFWLFGLFLPTLQVSRSLLYYSALSWLLRVSIRSQLK